ncbi:WhiB family transcriptional regulator [Streptosporangium sp. NPDC000563]|uniref:WhiB family transcriptional regulator n=1 Tax=Streptosporangium sp. NPDC000563 TaxID=3154366 RepID=UPI003330C64E
MSSLRRAYLKRREQLREAMFAAGPACTDADPDLFTAPDVFEPEPDTVREEREAAAKRICRTCPARPQCLAYALDIRPTEGVWAALSVEEIRTLSLFGIAPDVEQEVA